MAHAVKWAIMSTANIDRKVIPGAHASPKVELVAVASRDQARAANYAKTWEIQRAYGSYDALLADPEIEAVYISLPNSMHCEWAIKALEAGKHVLCEKPLSRHASEVEAAFDAADRAGRLLSEAFMYRHNPQTMHAKRLVDKGAIGELRLIRSAFSYSLYDEDNIRLRTALDGGALMDVGCYAVSGSRLFGGEPEKVYGDAWFGPSGTDWVFAGMLRFPGNVVALFDSGTAMTERDELEAIGSEGSLFLDDPWHCKVPGIQLRRGGKVERIELDPVDSYGSRSRTSATRSAAMASRSSAATTQSHRPGSLKLCTIRRCAAPQSRSDAPVVPPEVPAGHLREIAARLATRDKDIDQGQRVGG